MAKTKTCVHSRHKERGPIIMPKGSWCYLCDETNPSKNYRGGWSTPRDLTEFDLITLTDEIETRRLMERLGVTAQPKFCPMHMFSSLPCKVCRANIQEMRKGRRFDPQCAGMIGAGVYSQCSHCGFTHFTSQPKQPTKGIGMFNRRPGDSVFAVQRPTDQSFYRPSLKREFAVHITPEGVPDAIVLAENFVMDQKEEVGQIIYGKDIELLKQAKELARLNQERERWSKEAHLAGRIAEENEQRSMNASTNAQVAISDAKKLANSIGI
jgi:hypothetical protein